MGMRAALRLLVLLAAPLWWTSAMASECQDFCNQQHKLCTDHYCTPVTTGCSGGCSLWFTNYPNMCSRTCGNDALDPCRRAVMEKAAKCWEGCWRQKGLTLERYGQCMTPCSKTAEAEMEQCRKGGGMPPGTGSGTGTGTGGGGSAGGGGWGKPGGDGSRPDQPRPPADIPPPVQPPAKAGAGPCCGDGNCPDVIEKIRAGRPYHMVFDLTYAKFNDARYTGDYMTDPLGTVKGGMSYRCQYRGGEFSCSGFNQGTNGMGTWSYRNADPCELQVSLWGRVFTLCGDKIVDGQYGVVGHVFLE